MAVQQTISLFRGEDVLLTVVLTSGASVAAWSLAWYLRAEPEASGAPLVTRSTGNGGVSVTPSGAAGVFTVTIPAAVTVGLPVGTYRYDLWRLDPGEEVVLAYGECHVLGQVRHNPLA